MASSLAPDWPAALVPRRARTLIRPARRPPEVAHDQRVIHREGHSIPSPRLAAPGFVPFAGGVAALSYLASFY